MKKIINLIGSVGPVLQKAISRRKAFALSKDLTTLKIEIGSGPKTGSNGWITLDSCKECDITWNLLNGLPFPDSSVDMIYASHVFEHFYFNELVKLLKECWRVMAPGGELSIVVPNARLYIDAYYEKIDFPPKYATWAPGMPQTNSLMDKLNYTAYMGGHHKYMFDQENLLNLLALSGFMQCRPRDFDPVLDMAERRFESIYARAYK
jgi:predicted SAM-dependent methyltransferase